jgi:EAL domain-containing protein (putative c-di-GMP-specific phosphodiesterase class I)
MRSIGDPGVLELIAGELARANVDPARRAVEIDAAAAIRDAEIARDFVNGLRGIGCRSALDAFGAGPHAFECLRELPVDIVKIDGELIRRLPGGERDRALVRAIADAAHAFGARAGAVQVACADALAVLREAGADFAQGRHLGRSRPALDAAGGQSAG